MAMRFGVRPANGTDGAYMRMQCCARCKADHGYHSGGDPEVEACPIETSALFGEYSYPNPEGPPEWGTDFDTGVWVCLKFEPCGCGEEAPDGQ